MLVAMSSTVSPSVEAVADRFADVTSSDASLRRFLHGLPDVDQVGAESRVAGLGTRSIKTSAKAYAIDLAIRMVDLTTLEGADTPGKVKALAAKAMRPDPSDQSCPATAAVCNAVASSPSKFRACSAKIAAFSQLCSSNAIWASRR